MERAASVPLQRGVQVPRVGVSPVPAAGASPPTAGGEASARRTRWAWVFGIWTAIGLLSLCDGAFGRFAGDNPPVAARFVLGGMLNLWLWALATPTMMRLSRRFPLERGRWGRNAAVHFALGLAFSAASSALNLVLLNGLVPEFPRSFSRILIDETSLNVVSYLGVVAACHTIDEYRQWNERRLRASQLETELVKARFEAIEAQLRPQFLFRNLDNIAALVRAGESAPAVRMITGVGDLLRMTLRRDGAQEIPLEQELDFAERCLSLEQIRLGDRLRVHVDADPSTLDVPVPSLVLLPLLENAIRHGVEATRGDAPVEVELRAERAGDMLSLTVRDTGAGLADKAALDKPDGGLASTRARLAHLYGARGRLELSRSPGGGTLSSLRLPLGVAPENTE